jgi:UDPglucose--hexose-1-phosphate uridylyltransferase
MKLTRFVLERKRLVDSVVRQGLATNDWSIVVNSTSWSGKPNQYRKPNESEKRRRHEYEEHVDDCPFCAGESNEQQLASILSERNDAQTGQWTVRAVQNRFPVVIQNSNDSNDLTSEQGLMRKYGGRHVEADCVGQQEVIIETPKHNSCVALYGAEHAFQVLDVVRERCALMHRDDAIQSVHCFQNHGKQAGGSLLHPHMQVVGLPIVPLQQQLALDQARWYHKSHDGECVFCRVIADERVDHEGDGSRIVAENEHFVAIVPFAPKVEYSLWLMPKRHEAHFVKIDDDQLEALAHLLADCLGALYRLTDDCDYNMVMRTAPSIRSMPRVSFADGRNDEADAVPFSLLTRLLESPIDDYSHCYVEIVPRLWRASGITFCTGIPIIIGSPEQHAEELRRHLK